MCNPNFIVYTGAADTCKTSSVIKIAKYLEEIGFNSLEQGRSNLEENYGYGIPLDVDFGKPSDFYVLLDKNGFRIVCYSWSDMPSFIDWLDRYLTEQRNNGITIDLIIMASREASETLYDYTKTKLNLNFENSIEIPLGRMVRGTRRNKSRDWYVNSMFELVKNFVLPKYIKC